MATKAERFRSAAERSGLKRAPRPKPSKVARGSHNEAARAADHAGYQLEAVGPARRPSRKSTRKAANRQKAGVSLKRRESDRLESPKGLRRR
ncbi:MAG TPA: hypothetical protein VGP64_09475 [Polyangia bacterium]|jgi:hypothetical protein